MLKSKLQLLMLLVMTFISLAHADDYDEFQLKKCEESNRNYNLCLESEPKLTCLNKVLFEYTEMLYLPVNAVLRGLADSQECLVTSRNIEASLLSYPISNTKVYRGTRLIPEIENMVVSSCIQEQSFLSTSLNKKVALAFTNDALLEINSKNGRSIKKINPSEEEVIFAPKTWFKFIKSYKEDEADDYTVFELQEVNESECQQKVIAKGLKDFKIKIESASYGHNVSLDNIDNYTALFRKEFDGNSWVEYDLKDLVVDKSQLEKKSFNVNWYCVKNDKIIGPHTFTITGEGGGSSFTFGCMKDGKKGFYLY